MSSCSLSYLDGMFDCAARISCGSDAVTDPVTGRIISTLVFHLLFNHSRTSTKKMDSNVLCWDVQCISKFGYINLLEIPKKTTNGWVNILGIERV
jgi:hypothetical protein